MSAVATENSASARIVGRPFPKGISGNPGGLRADVRGRIERARRLALKLAPKAISTLASLLDAEDPRVRVAAAEGLLDRAGLRPFSLEPERVEIAAVPVDVEALRRSLAARVAQLAAGPGAEAAPALSEAPAASSCVIEVERVHAPDAAHAAGAFSTSCAREMEQAGRAP
jgi:hypothetical protein